jgi:hypothetical protein
MHWSDSDRCIQRFANSLSSAQTTTGSSSSLSCYSVLLCRPGYGTSIEINNRTETAVFLIRKFAGHIVSGKKIDVRIVYMLRKGYNFDEI